MNLNHVTDRLQMMYPSVQSQVPARYGAGDKAGLRNMGHRACFTPETTDPPATDEPDGPDYPTDGRADGICTIFAGDPDCAPVPDGICQVGDPTCYDGACNAADPADPDCSDVPVGEALPAPSLDAVSHYPSR
jgi:hypothetical protein